MDHFGQDARCVLRWNQTQKSGGLIIRSLEQWHEIDLDAQYDEYLNHIPDECKLCSAKKLFAEFNSYLARRAKSIPKQHLTQSGSCRECGLFDHNFSGTLCQHCHESGVDRMNGDSIGICSKCGIEKRITAMAECGMAASRRTPRHMK